MRYLAIDYGARRTGFAICDAEEIIASPLEVRDSTDDLCAYIVQQVKALGVEAIVLGLPFNMDGSEGFQAKSVRTFGQTLAACVTLPIHYQDERLSSYAAWEKRPDMKGGRRKKSKPVDALAAAEILNAFLESKHETASYLEEPDSNLGDEQ